MSHTLAEKLLASHVLDEGQPASPGKQREVRAGDLIEVAVDVVLANDITAPLAICEFEKLGVGSVFDPDAVVLVADHFTPNKDIASAEQCAVIRVETGADAFLRRRPGWNRARSASGARSCGSR